MPYFGEKSKQTIISPHKLQLWILKAKTEAKMNKGILQYAQTKHSWNRLIYIVIIFYLYIPVFGRKTKIDRTDISIYIILHKYKCIYKYWILHKWKNLLKNNTKFIVFLILNFTIFIIKKFKKWSFKSGEMKIWIYATKPCIYPMFHVKQYICPIQAIEYSFFV